MNDTQTDVQEGRLDEVGGQDQSGSQELGKGPLVTDDKTRVKKRGRRFIDLTSQRFTRLTVIECLGTMGRDIIWRCLCDCGNETTVPTTRLRSENTKSCGCLKLDVLSARCLKHGSAKAGGRSCEFNIWCSMRQRCNSESCQDFRLYGARGIKVCERWMKFENFIADMGPRPSSRHSIDRFPNNDGDYEPGNCRWATPQEQAANSRNARKLSFNGETHPITVWARKTGIHAPTLFRRLNEGWDVALALTLPPNRGRRVIVNKTLKSI